MNELILKLSGTSEYDTERTMDTTMASNASLNNSATDTLAIMNNNGASNGNGSSNGNGLLTPMKSPGGLASPNSTPVRTPETAPRMNLAHVHSLTKNA
jgi:hypothetical protein